MQRFRVHESSDFRDLELPMFGVFESSGLYLPFSDRFVHHFTDRRGPVYTHIPSYDNTLVNVRSRPYFLGRIPTPITGTETDPVFWAAIQFTIGCASHGPHHQPHPTHPWGSLFDPESGVVFTFDRTSFSVLGPRHFVHSVMGLFGALSSSDIVRARSE